MGGAQGEAAGGKVGDGIDVGDSAALIREARGLPAAQAVLPAQKPGGVAPEGQRHIDLLLAAGSGIGAHDLKADQHVVSFPRKGDAREQFQGVAQRQTPLGQETPARQAGVLPRLHRRIEVRLRPVIAAFIDGIVDGPAQKVLVPARQPLHLRRRPVIKGGGGVQAVQSHQVGLLGDPGVPGLRGKAAGAEGGHVLGEPVVPLQAHRQLLQHPRIP